MRRALAACTAVFTRHASSVQIVLETVLFVAITINCVGFPFQLAFHGPACGGARAVYIYCDVPLWALVVLELRRFRQRAACPRSARTAWRLMTSVLRCVGTTAASLPWDWLVASSEAWCLSYGHLPRLLFVVRLTAMVRHALNTIFPALGAQRARMLFVELVLDSLMPLHWLACLLYTVPRLTDSPELAWVALSALDERPLWARYVRSFDRALLVVLGEGVHGETDTEVLVSMLGLLLGTGLVASFTSRIVEIITSTNQFEQMTRQKIGRVQSFMRSANLPNELVQRCTAHLQHFMFSTSLTADTADLLRELSAPLRAEVALASRKQLVVAMLHKSRWFEGTRHPPSDFFVKQLVQRLVPAVFSPEDFILVEVGMQSEPPPTLLLSPPPPPSPSPIRASACRPTRTLPPPCPPPPFPRAPRHAHADALPSLAPPLQGEFGSEAYLIQSGVVRIPLKDGSTLRRSAGECIGEIAMITAAPRSSSVIADTFVEAYSLEQKDFLQARTPEEPMEGRGW